MRMLFLMSGLLNIFNTFLRCDTPQRHAREKDETTEEPDDSPELPGSAMEPMGRGMRPEA